MMLSSVLSLFYEGLKNGKASMVPKKIMQKGNS